MTDDLVNRNDREKGRLSTTAEGDGGRPRCFSSMIQEYLFVLTATMATGQSSFYQGMIVGITASIGRDLHMNSAEITWISAVAAYVSLSYSISTSCLSVADLSNYQGGV